MSSWAKTPVILGLLCITGQAVDEVHNYTEPFFLTFYSMSPNIESFMYMYCNRTKTPFYLNCSFKLKMTNGTRGKSCDVKLPAPEYVYKHYHFRTFRLKSVLGGNKAVFEWALRYYQDIEYTTHSWISIVDMNECSVVQMDLPLEREGSNFHVLPGNLLVNVYMESWEKCDGDSNPCLLRFNLHTGNQTDGPIPLPPKYFINELTMLVDRSNTNSGGYFVELEDRTDGSALMSVSHLKCDGSEKVIIKNHFVKNNFLTMMFSAQSNENMHYSFCHPSEFVRMEAVRCIQSDVNGHKRMNVTVTLERNYMMLAVFNRPQGGVLLVTIDCHKPGYNCTDSRVKVKEVAVDGEVVRDTELTGLKLDGFVVEFQKFSVDHSETETEHCFYFAYVQQSVRARRRRNAEATVFKYIKKCMDKATSTGDVLPRVRQI